MAVNVERDVFIRSWRHSFVVLFVEIEDDRVLRCLGVVCGDDPAGNGRHILGERSRNSVAEDIEVPSHQLKVGSSELPATIYGGATHRVKSSSISFGVNFN